MKLEILIQKLESGKLRIISTLLETTRLSATNVDKGRTTILAPLKFYGKLSTRDKSLCTQCGSATAAFWRVRQESLFLPQNEEYHIIQSQKVFFFNPPFVYFSPPSPSLRLLQAAFPFFL